MKIKNAVVDSNRGSNLGKGYQSSIQGLSHKTPKQVVLAALKHAMVLVASFCLFKREIELYLMEVSKVTKETTKKQIMVKYEDLHGAFNEEASNDLLDHGVLDMKIEFKDRQEPCNTNLQPIPLVELKELW